MSDDEQRNQESSHDTEMEDSLPDEGDAASDANRLDPAALEAFFEELHRRQRFIPGLMAGVVAAAVGAGAWAAVTAATGYQIGWMAVGIGALVGLAVRGVGRGVTPVFGYAGAVLSLLGCLAGNLLTVCTVVAQDVEEPLTEILTSLTPSIAWELMVATFDPIDLLFYGIAVYEGYRLSFRRINQEHLTAGLQPEQESTTPEPSGQ